ncbi:membrane fusion protein, multidrug efflux system [Desulfacinum hydrothermale DSM 13146]|uniref:Membrane fusion protein, multidrug efflux system n=1 Tax=Desulfacinum hydrothermale DSM 13146 TaxID=1121390 RepID=A0A1W1XGI8_9BACT|nr:HlyD family secretion protein [Desulfacinum hydrothermale]SMC23060.1 membrane fusion protein, multidrug efflux system [Desulfacinum hydrothermale DSM 13146]
MAEKVEERAPAEAAPVSKGNHAKRILFLVLMGAAVLGAVYWWFFVRHKESTDNAYVMADVAAVSARIPGTVQAVHVENDDFVRKGQELLTLDPADFQVQVAEAQAAIKRLRAETEAAVTVLDYLKATTEAGIRGAEAALSASQAQWEAAKEALQEVAGQRDARLADWRHAKRDWQRFSALAREGAASVRDRDRMKTALRKAEAGLASVEARYRAALSRVRAAEKEVSLARAKLDEAKAARMQVDVQAAKIAALRAQEKELQAKLEKARLHLSYCRITAPLDGYVAQRRIQMGERVQPGQPLLAVVPLHHVYVEANFKETQVEKIRIGQPVEVTADCYPGKAFRGRVTGIRSGTGAAFSLLPPENATGNWVKITQRVPVRIELENPFSPDFPLRVGFSLEVTVDTSDQSGPRLRAAAEGGRS